MTQENFQPQVPDTTNGANVHTYIPRADGSIVVGGVVYLPQTRAATATAPAAIPVTVSAIPAVPVAPAPAVVTPVTPALTQTYFTPPGGPSVPVGPAGFNVQSPRPLYPYFPYQQPPYCQYASAF